MHVIQNNLELVDFQRTGIGFISNSRNNGVKLHCAGCIAVGGVVSAIYPKYHFETYAEAAQWLDKKYIWNLCGI